MDSHLHTHLSPCKLCTDISLTATLYGSAFAEIERGVLIKELVNMSTEATYVLKWPYADGTNFIQVLTTALQANLAMNIPFLFR